MTGLRDAIARTLADQEAVAQGALPYSDLSWSCIRHEWLGRADAVLAVFAEHSEPQVYRVGDPYPGTRRSTIGALDPLVGRPKP